MITTSNPAVKANRVTHLKYTIRFTVRGKGQFPYDMLRYDGCLPASERDAYAMSSMGDAFGEVRTVDLISHQERSFWLPTVGRWQSFGWHVLQKGEE